VKILIAEDDFISRLLLQELLKTYGQAHVAVNGREALEAVRVALESDRPYDLICLDIMMPEMSGQDALKEIRRAEESRGVPGQARAKIIMTTALADKANVVTARDQQCDSFLVKPIERTRLVGELRRLKLIA
jgi:two-component system chemotaxis response regulator CheY